MGRKSGSDHYGVESLVIGGSLSVPYLPEIEPNYLRARVSVDVCRKRKRTGRHFIVKSEPEGVRVTRIAS